MEVQSAARIEYLPMQRSDLDAVLAIEHEVFPYPWTRGNFTDSLDSGYLASVCRRNDQIIGYFVLMTSLDEAHLLTIGLATRCQKQGLGARLLRHAMTVGKAAQARRLLLEVRRSNVSALGLYQHFGFRQVGVRKGYYPADGGREDALVLERDLEDVTA